ncbi:heme-binding protein [Azohydromonas aeria]|uniref:heme-binding protein n=1 Tax=Azohydromonas aeria TaxID=2590212 RepID=UPI0012FC07B0|nr:heme-binding protein [Azohydromonas aeria]
MNAKPYLTLDVVRGMAAAAQAEARRNAWPVCIAVVDDGGHLLWLEREDGAAPATAAIAIAKAQTAAQGRRESRFYEEMLNAGRTGFLSAPGLGCLLEGGVPVVVDGHVVGALGVSGVKSHEDAQVARAGCAVLSA